MVAFFTFLHVLIYNVLPLLIVISVLVFVHEWGHYIVARFYKLKVDIFSIGFGPVLFDVKDSAGTRWCFSAIPLGGYVKFHGDEDISSMVQKNGGRSPVGVKAVDGFHQRPNKEKIPILLAGPLANIIFAFVILQLFYALHGVSSYEPVVGHVQPLSVAETYGLKRDDRVVMLNEREIVDFRSLRDAIAGHRAGDDMVIDVERDGAVMRIIIPQMKESMLGIRGSGEARMEDGRPVINDISVGESMRHAWAETVYISGAIFRFLGRMVSGGASIEELGGPVRIAEGTAMAVAEGWQSTIHLMALISINLGIFNLLPIPPLDGGQIFLYGIEKLGRKQAAFIRSWGYPLGFFFLVMLLVVVTWNDIARLVAAG
ncbi:MAG: RIP metalloprotease [Alphaproteobacteria bacterium GM7ARS4]|nr:RIP metalloprotease [Alphaproteobacteria bacterium GM7ARS4]